LNRFSCFIGVPAGTSSEPPPTVAGALKRSPLVVRLPGRLPDLVVSDEP